MTQYNARQRPGITRDRRSIWLVVGVVTVASTVLLQPLASDAAAGDPTPQPSQSAEAAGSGQADTVASVDPNAKAGPNAKADPAPIPAGGAEPQPAPGNGPATPAPASSPVVNPTSAVAPVGQQAADGSTPPAVDILGNSCEGSKLPAHDGFQNGGRCISTEFGEVANAQDNPSLIIASAPQIVRANRPFDLRVSTRNLVRDRFLAAGKGGYYKESSFLNADGLVRGHFHTACRILGSRRTAPDPAPVPAFFAATEDGAGGRTPDTVTVRVTGLPAGLAQCAVWAGDGSHRAPMMQRANQIPAFDVVRIVVR